MTETTVTNTVLSMSNTELIATVKTDLAENHRISLNACLQAVNPETLTDADLREIAKIYGITVKEVTATLTQMARYRAVEDTLGEYPVDEYEFVRIQLTQWKTTMSFHGEFTIDTPYDLRDGNKLITKEDLLGLDAETVKRIQLADPKTFNMARMLEKLRYQCKKLKLPFHKDRALEHALNYWVNNYRDDLSSQIVSELVYAGDVYRDLAEAEWDRYVEAITQVNQEETKTVIKHFIWQVKRKMFRLPVKYHMMLIFKGKQEAGKSTMAKDLTSPVREFVASTNFADITDSRSHSIWNNLVLFFDEMGRSTTSNLEDIKRIITEDSFTSRIMNTNTDTVIKNRATCCGTTNKDLSRLIFDDTGMRRFFQVDCRDKIDWTVTAMTDFKKLWRSVNENAETPLVTDEQRWTQIKTIQNSKRQQSMMEMWLRKRPHQAFVEQRIAAQAFYEEFVEFERARSGNNRSDTTMTKFGRDILDIALLVEGLELGKDKTSKGHFYRICYTQAVD